MDTIVDNMPTILGLHAAGIPIAGDNAIVGDGATVYSSQ